MKLNIKIKLKTQLSLSHVPGSNIAPKIKIEVDLEK